jgi:hypothetical protein
MAGSFAWARRIGHEAGSYQTVAWLQRRPCPSLAVEIEAASIQRAAVRRWDSLGRRVREMCGRCAEAPLVWKCVKAPTCRTVAVAVEKAVVDVAVAEGSVGLAVEPQGTEGVWRWEQRQVQGHGQGQERQRWVEAASVVVEQSMLKRRPRRCSVASSPYPCRRHPRPHRCPRSCTFGYHHRPMWKMVDTPWAWPA